MNGAHLHLMVTHLPVLGLLFGTLLLAYAWWRGSEEVRRLTLAFMAVAGLFAIPAFFSGESAEDLVEKLPGVSGWLIHEHEEAAEGAAIAGVVTAVLAAGLLAFGLRRGATPRWGVAGVALGGVISSIWMGVAAFRGGSIRHPEMDGASASTSGETSGRD